MANIVCFACNGVIPAGCPVCDGTGSVMDRRQPTKNDAKVELIKDMMLKSFAVPGCDCTCCKIARTLQDD